jgi:elongation factor P
MASASDFRKGMTIIYKDDIYIVTEFQHVNPGKGQAFIRTKLKNLKTGKVLDNSFRLSDKIETVRVNNKEMLFLYKDGTDFIFMDKESYEQMNLSKELIGEYEYLLKENIICNIMTFEDNPISFELPIQVDYKVVEVEPFEKGDTASNVTKPVTIETGAKIRVPAFIKEGDIVTIDTRTGEYLSRKQL